MINLLIDNILTAKNGLFACNGASIDDVTGAISFPSTGGTQYGPYWPLPEGTYEITYTGKNLSSVINAYNAYVSEKFYGTITMKSTTPSTVIYEVTIPENVGTIEFVYSNLTDKVLTINNIRIKQL